MPAVERQLTVPGEPPLSGTLTLPSVTVEIGISKFPAVLFIHGSGPLDRNENARFAKLNVFNYLAEKLGMIGFASFRYDKRGVGKSKGSYLKAGLWDLVGDAARALAVLKNQPEIDPGCIILLGHSEGCIIAPLVCQKNPVAGMILLMAPADRLDVIIGYQGEMMDDAVQSIKGLKGRVGRFSLRIVNGGKISEANQRLLKKIRESTKPVIRFRLNRVNAKWIREHMAIDPEEVYSSVTCPVLVMNGSKDLQVRPSDVKKIAGWVKGPCEWHIIERETHILRKDPRDTPSVLHYKRLVKESVDPEIPQLIGKWLALNSFGRYIASLPEGT
jgi:hypothetical protein